MRKSHCDICGEPIVLPRYRRYCSTECRVKGKAIMHKNHPDYYERNTWRGMLARCNDPSNKKYDNYGGRGIMVHLPWAMSFRQFKADMGAKPTPKHELDRIDNDGHYEPSNCRWVTHKENTRKKSSVHLDSESAETIKKLYVMTSLKQNQLAEMFGVSQQLISAVVNGKVWA